VSVNLTIAASFVAPAALRLITRRGAGNRGMGRREGWRLPAVSMTGLFCSSGTGGLPHDGVRHWCLYRYDAYLKGSRRNS